MKVNRPPTDVTTYLDWRKANWDAMKTRLSEFASTFQVDIHSRTVDENNSQIEQAIHQAIREYVPTATRKANFHGSHSVPIDRATIKLIRQKHRALRRFRGTRDPQRMAEYQALRRKVANRSRSFHRKHLANVSNSLTGDGRGFWRHVKSLRQDTVSIPDLMNPDGSFSRTPLAKANTLNTQYQSVFTDEPNGILPNFVKRTPHVLPDFNITEEGVRKQFRELNPKKLRAQTEYLPAFSKHARMNWPAHTRSYSPNH